MPPKKNQNNTFSGQDYTKDKTDRLSRSMTENGRKRYCDVTIAPVSEQDENVEGGSMEVSSSTDDLNDFKVRAKCFDVKIRFGSAATPSNGRSVGLECRKCSHTNKWCFTLISVHGGSDLTLFREDVEDVKFGPASDVEILVFVFLPTMAFAKNVTEKLALNKANGDVLDPQSSAPGAASIVVDLSDRDMVDKKKFRRDFDQHFKEFKDIGKLSSDQAYELLHLSDRAKTDLQKPITISASPGLHVDHAMVEKRSDDRNAGVKGFFCHHLGIGAFLKRDCLFVARVDLHRFTIIPDKYEMDRLGNLKAESVEFFQLDPESRVVNVEVQGNLGVDLCATLTRVLSSRAKEDMVNASKKLRSASLRLQFHPDTDMNDVRSSFLKMKLREEKLEADFATNMFPELRRISPASSDVSVVKEVQPLQQKRASRMSSSALNNPVILYQAPVSLVAPPTAARKGNGCLPGSSVNFAMFDASKQMKRVPDTSIAARNAHHLERKAAPAKRASSRDKPIHVANKKTKTLVLDEEPEYVHDDDENIAPISSLPAKPPAISGLALKNGASDRSLVALKTANHRKPVAELALNNRMRDAAAAQPRPTPVLNLEFLKEIGKVWESHYRKYEEWEKEQGKTANGTGRRTRTRAIDSGEARDAENGVSEDMIVLSDVDEETDEPSSSTAPKTVDTIVPDGCHEIFRNLRRLDRITVGLAEIAAADVFQLAKGQQLGDGFVQFMIEMLDSMLNEEDRKNIYIFSYFFFQTYLGAVGGHVPKTLPDTVAKRLAKHSAKAGIFDRTHLVIPVLNEGHWYLALVCHPDPHKCPENQKTYFVIMDSLMQGDGGAARHKFTFNLLTLWLESEYSRLKQKKHSYGTKDVPRIVVKIPQQQNGVDCGIFLINALTFFLRHKPQFSSTKQPGNLFSGSKPNVDKWFDNSADAVEKKRLQMLDYYYTVAAASRHFVYRTDYIPDAIADLGKEMNDLDLIEKLPITVEESPKRVRDPKRKTPEEDAVERRINVENGGKTRNGETSSQANSLKKTLSNKSKVQWVCPVEVSRLPRARIPDIVTDLQFLDDKNALTQDEREFYMCAGWLEPEYEKRTDEQREELHEWLIKRRLKRKEALKNPSPFPKLKKAEEYFTDFMAM